MLKILQSGINPLGQFDGLDSDVLTLKGGEVVSFAQVTTSGQPGVTTGGLDQAAYDAFDGYVNVAGTFKRPVVTRRWDGSFLSNTGFVTGTPAQARPLMLSDDGISGYGTLFGTVVGGTVGQVSYGPSSTVAAANLLGPNTSTGAGKTTCWDKPGTYAVSLDATDTTAATGLQPTNTSLFVGCPLSFTGWDAPNTGGLLTPALNSNPNVINFQGASGPLVGHFIEFNTNQSLVTTPNYLVAALNSPSGNVSSVGPRAFQFATFYFSPAST
jgi:hypothetical protein